MSYVKVDQEYAVVDMETGEVMSSDLAVIPWPESLEEQAQLLAYPEAAKAYATFHGKSMHVESD